MSTSKAPRPGLLSVQASDAAPPFRIKRIILSVPEKLRNMIYDRSVSEIVFRSDQLPE